MRRPPLPFVLSTAAVAWGLALVAFAYLLPVYAVESETGSCTPGGRCTSTTVTTGATLVQENGGGVLVVIGVLAGVAAIGWLGLHVYCASGRRPGLLVGWCAAVAMAGFTLVSFGLGFFTLPMAIMMILAAIWTPGPGAERSI
jgi:hypothetical protein